MLLERLIRIFELNRDMYLQLLDYATLIVYLAFAVDLLIQIFHVYKRKSSLDVSIKGIGIRLVGSTILALKMFTTQDVFLILGQSIFAVIVFGYLVILIHYRKR